MSTSKALVSPITTLNVYDVYNIEKNYRAYSSKHDLKRWIFSKMVESSVLSVTLKGITY